MADMICHPCFLLPMTLTFNPKVAVQVTHDLDSLSTFYTFCFLGYIMERDGRCATLKAARYRRVT